MNRMGKFLSRCRAEGIQGAGVGLDVASYLLGRLLIGLKPEDYFRRRQLKHSRLGWIHYPSDRLIERMRRLNPPEAVALFTEKDRFNQRFAAYIGREWISPREVGCEAFTQFLARHNTAFCKSRTGMGGQMTGLIHYSEDDAEMAALYRRLCDEDCLVEERLSQHPDMRRIYPHSINTVRVSTVRTPQGTVCIQAFLRTGHSGRVADNYDMGGVVVWLDPKTGLPAATGYDKAHRLYTAHPDTQFPYADVRIPDWQGVMDLCLRAAQEVPEALYIGWDVGITPEGPVLVEGNTRPSVIWIYGEPHGAGRLVRKAYRGAKRLKKNI